MNNISLILSLNINQAKAYADIMLIGRRTGRRNEKDWTTNKRKAKSWKWLDRFEQVYSLGNLGSSFQTKIIPQTNK